MATAAQRARTAAEKKYTIVADSVQDVYDIVECADPAKGIAELNAKYPPGSGWMIVDTADTEEEAMHKILEHRAEARHDFE
jgi:hypothetical protein